MCPCCDGAGAFLGTLGLIRWYRCSQCGMNFSKKIRRSKKKV